MQGTLNQPYVALLCVYVGMGGMLVYCLLRRLGSLLHLGRVGRMLVELLFCLGFACFCAWVFYALLNLRLRGFYLLGMLLGALLYRFGIHALLEEIFRKIYKFGAKFLHKK